MAIQRLVATDVSGYVFEHEGVETGVTAYMDKQLAKQYSVMPLKKVGETLIVGTEETLHFWAHEKLSERVGLAIYPVQMTKSLIDKLIQYHYSEGVSTEGLEMGITQSQVLPTSEVVERIQNTPVVQLVDGLLEEAIRLGASDVHILPKAHTISVMMRIEGILQQKKLWQKSVHEALVTRLKVMAGMNIAEKRVPQEGNLEWRDGEVAMRLAVLPTVEGEKVAIRLFHLQRQHLRTIETLGMAYAQKERLYKCMGTASGLVLVTGPTGSGKSTTLYAALTELVKQKRGNILTLEDPVETKIEGITQVSVNEKGGMSFEVGLKALLRQDPDVMMIGEIRDAKTARTAITLALTGHLVLSTLHTRDVAGTIARLLDMGIESYLLEEALRGVVAQRLVGKLCPYCKRPVQTTAKMMQTLGIRQPTIIYEAVGCDQCHDTGYQDRVGVYEVVPSDTRLRHKIRSGEDVEALRVWLEGQYDDTLQSQLKELVLQGVTSLENYRRVGGGVDDEV